MRLGVGRPFEPAPARRACSLRNVVYVTAAFACVRCVRYFALLGSVPPAIKQTAPARARHGLPRRALAHVPSLDELGSDWLLQHSADDRQYRGHVRGVPDRAARHTFDEVHAGRGLVCTRRGPGVTPEVTPIVERPSKGVLVHRDMPVITSGLGSVGVSRSDCFAIDSLSLPPYLYPGVSRCFMPRPRSRSDGRNLNGEPLPPEAFPNESAVFTTGGVPLPRQIFGQRCATSALRVQLAGESDWGYSQFDEEPRTESERFVTFQSYGIAIW